MEGMFEKVWGKGSSDNVDVRKRKASGCAAYLLQGSCSVVPQLSKASSVRLNYKDIYRGCKCASQRDLYQFYVNFMRSRTPCRLMCFQNNEWVDLPSEILGLVRKDFHLLLDFLHMIHLDVKTGLEQPLAWMDEVGSCFFPMLLTVGGVQDGCCQCYADKEDSSLLFGAQRQQEIKLQIAIEINGGKYSPSAEYCKDSNPIIKSIKVGQYHPNHHLDTEVEDSCDMVIKSNPNVDKNVEHSEKILDLDNQSFADTLAYEEVIKMFLKGIRSADGADIVNISRCSGSILEARMELFQKQLEITKKYCGDANVRYAWLPSSKEALSSVMACGLGLSKFESLHGIGVPLAAADFSGTSANDDENGVRHMILCRVIMGKMKLINPGSKQFHPSSETFDSGVDDLDNPQQYTVWSMNINTHICPEFVVSFRISPAQEGEGTIAGSHNLEIPGVIAGQQVPELLSNIDARASSVNMRSDYQSNLIYKGCKERSMNLNSTPARTTTCPRVPFPVLFAAVSNKLSADDMKLISAHHELYMTGKIPRVDLVRELRRRVGDPLLMSIINTLQVKGASENKATAEVLQEAETRQERLFGGGSKFSDW